MKTVIKRIESRRLSEKFSEDQNIREESHTLYLQPSESWQ